MNLYDIVDEDMYKEYVKRSTSFLSSIKAGAIAAGTNPFREICGQARSNFIIAKFHSVQDFEAMLRWQEDNDIKRLRELSTDNYIWTLYENWDMAAWLAD